MCELNKSDQTKHIFMAPLVTSERETKLSVYVRFIGNVNELDF